MIDSWLHLFSACMRTFFILLVTMGLALCGCKGSFGSTSSSGSLPPPGESGGGIPAPYGLDTRPLNSTCLAPDRPPSVSQVKLEQPFPNLPNFNEPIWLLQAPGDPSTFYVVERRGVIRQFSNTPGVNSSTVFLDINSLVNSEAGSEAGLLGMAFHPKYPEVQQFFLSLTTGNGQLGCSSSLCSVIIRYQLPNKTAPEVILGPLTQPEANHNGGHILFGPDGYLYFGLGDGGGGGDPNNFAQNKNSLLGKMVRVDVNDTFGAVPAYTIPPSNPFASNGQGSPEIFALGLRNPWRWSFDRATGDLWLGDVGQNAREEVDLITLGGNYGWRCYEGDAVFNPSGCQNKSTYVAPIVDHERSGPDAAQAITGGYVYRGTTLDSLQGRYVYGDYVTGNIWAWDTEAKASTRLLDTNLNIASFAEDLAGELYVVHLGGEIYKFVPQAMSAPSNFPTKLSETGCVQPNAPTNVSDGLIPFAPNAPFWSDGATKHRYFAIPDGSTIQIATDGDFIFPIGTVLLKNFDLNGQRIETRLFVRHTDGGWAGYSYEWNDAETDATYVPSGSNRSIQNITWHYPARAECTRCHTKAAGDSLGLELAQLNGEYVYPNQRRSNQLATLEHIGLIQLSTPLNQAPSLVSPNNTAQSLNDRARAYLHTNCASCHREGGAFSGGPDFRFSLPLSQTLACNVDASRDDLGIAGLKRIAPGDASKSAVVLRMKSTTGTRMPPISSNVPDTEGISLVEAWINSLTGCTP